MEWSLKKETDKTGILSDMSLSFRPSQASKSAIRVALRHFASLTLFAPKYFQILFPFGVGLENDLMSSDRWSFRADSRARWRA